MGNGSSNSLREKVALVIFALLVIAGGVMAVAYFSSGRQWSHTATIVDDATGNLQDYSAVVFAGTRPDASKNSDEGGVSEMADDDLGSGGVSVDAVKVRILAIQKREKEQKIRSGGLYVSDVRDIYEMKGANVVTLNLSRKGLYKKPSILGTNGKKFGVFRISKYTSKASLKSTVKKLRKKGADGVICICPNASAAASLDGIDIVIELLPRKNAEQHEAQGNATIFESPERGSVGMILFTSNNVASTKVLKHL